MLLTAWGLWSLGAPVSAQVLAPTALPTGGTVVSGGADISNAGSTLHIQQSTDKASINWTSFNVGTGANVNIQQPNKNALLLNRVVGNDASQILGRINANGQVMLINPNGIMFGKDGSVTATSFTASTLGISDADFVAGNYKFKRNGSTAGVVNQGTIQTHGGYVALMGASVSNQGVISTQGGNVALVAGESVKLPSNIGIPLGRSGKVRLEVDASTLNAAVSNTSTGLISTQGGQVLLQAKAVRNAIASVVVSGDIHTSATQGGAVTVLSENGTVKVDAKITTDSSASSNASAARGGDIVIGRDELTGSLASKTDVSKATLQSSNGFVETSGDYLQTEGTRVQAAQWLLDPSDISISTSVDANITGTSPAAITPNGGNGSTSVVNVATIQNAINAGTSVTLQTTNSGNTTGAGNITINSALVFNNTGETDATLNLVADNGITQQASITATGTKLVNITMTANGNYQGIAAASPNSAGILINAPITTNGAITLDGNSSATHGVTVFGELKTTGLNSSTTLRSSAGTIYGTGAITTAANNTGTVTIDPNSNVRSSIYGGIISGGTSFNMAGSDLITLSNDQTYTGTTTVSRGQLNLGGTLATGDIINNGVFVFTRGGTVDLLVPNNIRGTGQTGTTGPAKIILTGTNTYSGGTRIFGSGKLQIGQGGSAGTLGTGAILNNGQLIFNRDASADITVNDTITGAGSIIQMGSGKTILTANNTYIGATTINAGTLQVGNGGTNGTLGSGAMTNNSNLIINKTGTVTLGSIASHSAGFVGTGNMKFIADGKVTVDRDINLTGPSSVIDIQSTNLNGVALELAPPAGKSSISLIAKTINVNTNNGTGGRLSIKPDSTVILGDVNGTATLNFSSNNYYTVLSHGQSAIPVLDTYGLVNINAIYTGSDANYGAVYISGDVKNTGGSLNLVADSSNSAAQFGFSSAYAQLLSVKGNISIKATAGSTFNPNTRDIALSALTSICDTNLTLIGQKYGITKKYGLGSNSGIFHLDMINNGVGGSIVNLDASDFRVNGGLSLISANDINISTNIYVDGGLVVSNESNTAIISGYIWDWTPGAASSLVKNGSGTLTLAGTNDWQGAYAYTGGTTINSGTLTVNSLLGRGQVVNNSNLVFSQPFDREFKYGISGTGNITQAGTGKTILSANNTYSGTTTISAGALQVGNGGATGTLGTGAVINNAALVLNRDATSNLTISGDVSGTGRLTQSGAGTSILTGNNSYSGATTISGGTLQIGNGGSTGTLGTGGAVTLSNHANLSYLRSAATTVANNISGNGNVSANITGSASNLNVSNSINLSGGTVNLATDANLSVSQVISTTDTSSSAVLLVAGQSTAAGTSTGGDVTFSGSAAVSVGSGGRATVMSGSVAGSTGLTALVGSGTGKFRYNSSKATTNYMTALGTGLYGIYREAPVLSATLNSASRTYDGTSYAGGNGAAPYIGLVNGDANGQTSAITYGGTSQSATNAGSYVISGTAASALGYAVSLTSGALTINKANLTQVAASKTYDGLSTVKATQITSIQGINGETFSATAGTATISDKNVATANKTLTDLSALTLTSSNGGLAGNYNLSSNLPVAGVNNNVTVATKSVIVTVTASNKTYDGTTLATVTTNSADVIGSDSVGIATTSATFNNKNAGRGKTVSVSGITLTGADAANYTLASTTATTTADVSKATLTVTAQPDSKVFDGSTSSGVAPTVSGLQGGDGLSNSPSQSYLSPYAGTGKTIQANDLVVDDGTGGNNYALRYVNNTNGVIYGKADALQPVRESNVQDPRAANALTITTDVPVSKRFTTVNAAETQNCVDYSTFDSSVVKGRVAVCFSSSTGSP